MEYFGDNLVRVCGLHRLSLVEAAKQLNVSRPALTTWVSGRARPHSDTLLRIADFFEVNAYQFGNEPFEVLIEGELSKPGRFRRVESKLGRNAPKLTVVHGLDDRL